MSAQHPIPLVLIPALLCDEAMYRAVVNGLGSLVTAQIHVAARPSMSSVRVVAVSVRGGFWAKAKRGAASAMVAPRKVRRFRWVIIGSVRPERAMHEGCRRCGLGSDEVCAFGGMAIRHWHDAVQQR